MVFVASFVDAFAEAPGFGPDAFEHGPECPSCQEAASVTAFL